MQPLKSNQLKWRSFPRNTILGKDFKKPLKSPLEYNPSARPYLQPKSFPQKIMNPLQRSSFPTLLTNLLRTRTSQNRLKPKWGVAELPKKSKMQIPSPAAKSGLSPDVPTQKPSITRRACVIIAITFMEEAHLQPSASTRKNWCMPKECVRIVTSSATIPKRRSKNS